MFSLLSYAKCVLLCALFGQSLAVPAPFPHSTLDLATRTEPSVSGPLSARAPPDFVSEYQTVRVQGTYMKSLNYSSTINGVVSTQNVDAFLDLQSQTINRTGATELDFGLTPNPYWLSSEHFEPNNFFLGLYVREMPGQILTWRVLLYAVEALRAPPEAGIYSIAASKVGRAFTFDIYMSSVQIAQAVVPDCSPSAGNVDKCFKPFM
ncbi:MAG: hypothetical protein M1812_004199 [Candelaria pacifica]|nr:MAG: hypothetical protein M1812_004199 [Candelaria pacifica]